MKRLPAFALLFLAASASAPFAQEADSYLRMQLPVPLIITPPPPEHLAVEVEPLPAGYLRVSDQIDLGVTSNFDDANYLVAPVLNWLTISDGRLSGIIPSHGVHSFSVVAERGDLRDESDPVEFTAHQLPSLSYGTSPVVVDVNTAMSTIMPSLSGIIDTVNCSPVAASGSLPAGISISSDCRIQGTPTQISNRTFTVSGVDVADNHAFVSDNISIHVLAPASKATGFRHNNASAYHNTNSAIRFAMSKDRDLVNYRNAEISGAAINLSSGNFGEGTDGTGIKPALTFSPAVPLSSVSVTITCPHLYTRTPWASLPSGGISLWGRSGSNWTQLGSWTIPSSTNLVTYTRTFSSRVLSEVELRTSVPAAACYISEYVAN